MFMGARDPNSSLLAYVARTLPTETWERYLLHKLEAAASLG